MSDEEEVKIHCWSCPRSCSTALTYSVSPHPLFTCVDEPLYATHLHRNPSLKRPYKDALLKSQPYGVTDDNAPLLQELKRSRGTPFVFFKHMSKHFPLINDPVTTEELKDKRKHRHILLVRDPLKVIMSWSRAVESGNTQEDAFTMDEIGLNFFSDIMDKFEDVVVVDSDRLVQDPEKTLKIMFEKLGIEFSEKMMSWEPGPKDFDGIWADYWYGNAHKSTGWSHSVTKLDQEIKPELQPLLDQCTPYYLKLMHSVIC